MGEPPPPRPRSGERPVGAAKGKQSDTQALCQPPPPPGTPAADQPTHLTPPPPSRPPKVFAPGWGPGFEQAAPLDSSLRDKLLGC